MMSCLTGAWLVVVLVLGAVSSAEGQIAQFSGKWKNVDPNTRTLTTLQIIAGERLRIHAWGKCVPSDCAWSVADGYAYGPSVQTDLIAGAEVISAVFVTQFSAVLLLIRTLEKRKLQVEILTRYTDQSGRTNVSEVVVLEHVPASD